MLRRRVDVLEETFKDKLELLKRRVDVLEETFKDKLASGSCARIDKIPSSSKYREINISSHHEARTCSNRYNNRHSSLYSKSVKRNSDGESDHFYKISEHSSRKIHNRDRASHESRNRTHVEYHDRCLKIYTPHR